MATASDASMTDIATSAAPTPATAAAAAATHHLTDEERQVYDRQLRVWGVEAQKRMRDSSVLVVGLRGLSCEVSKSIVLAGIGSLVLMDDSTVTEQDLSANFLITEANVGQNRAEAAVAHLRELNPNVNITANTASLSSVISTNPSYFSQFRAVCLVSQPLDLQVAVNTLLRTQAATAAASATPAALSSAPPAFFSGESFGVYAYFFEDLQRHTYTHTRTTKDARGNEEETIASDTKVYTRTLASLVDASIPYTQLAKSFGRKRQEKEALDAWLTMRTVLTWRGLAASPSTVDESAVAVLTAQRESLVQQIGLPATSVPQDALVRMARMSGGELAHVCAIVGGILGQEILKVLSGKDEPLSNTFVFSAEESYGLMKEL